MFGQSQTRSQVQTRRALVLSMSFEYLLEYLLLEPLTWPVFAITCLSANILPARSYFLTLHCPSSMVDTL